MGNTVAFLAHVGVAANVGVATDKNVAIARNNGETDFMPYTLHRDR